MSAVRDPFSHGGGQPRACSRVGEQRAGPIGGFSGAAEIDHGLAFLSEYLSVFRGVLSQHATTNSADLETSHNVAVAVGPAHEAKRHGRASTHEFQHKCHSFFIGSANEQDVVAALLHQFACPAEEFLVVTKWKVLNVTAPEVLKIPDVRFSCRQYQIIERQSAQKPVCRLSRIPWIIGGVVEANNTETA
jgi:hypothetical protein